MWAHTYFGEKWCNTKKLSYQEIQGRGQRLQDLNKDLQKSCSSLLTGNIKNVVSTNESVAIFLLQLTVNIFFGLFQSNVHVAVQAIQNATIIDTRVQLDNYRITDQVFQEFGWSRHDFLLLKRLTYFLFPFVLLTLRQVEKMYSSIPNKHVG